MEDGRYRRDGGWEVQEGEKEGGRPGREGGREGQETQEGGKGEKSTYHQRSALNNTLSCGHAVWEIKNNRECRIDRYTLNPTKTLIFTRR